WSGWGWIWIRRRSRNRLRSRADGLHQPRCPATASGGFATVCFEVRKRSKLLTIDVLARRRSGLGGRRLASIEQGDRWQCPFDCRHASLCLLTWQRSWASSAAGQPSAAPRRAWYGRAAARLSTSTRSRTSLSSYVFVRPRNTFVAAHMPFRSYWPW